MVGLEILVVGATGKQGHATIAALEALPPQTPPIRIFALTRSLTSPKAQALQEEFPSIELVRGDLAEPQPIFSLHPSITSVFQVTVPPNDEQQALPMIDAASAHGVAHIVFSSVDRGGESVSWENATTVPHFAAKHRIELYLKEKTRGTHTEWTILRPAGFMDNYNPDLFGKMMAGLWATMQADKKMQLVSVKDIGIVAASVLTDVKRWKGRALGIAGDDLTFAQADAIFQTVRGHGMPRIWDIPSRALRWVVDDAQKSMDWFEKEGFRVDVEVLKAEGFEVQTFEQWLSCSK
ncbi:NAD(P)-binding protein [Karstenula rhodostoma CBS 690.94]|uniref:NAD(P)-binding protein n=1 Tax=Karstenula rhodostoma CBS 690.94 TaxID=1392251 RepID=A0A9P4PH43_9PLEO|nr:NAD(P)-binding protein [Karstenula rhodostoma CBS 690.94]